MSANECVEKGGSPVWRSRRYWLVFVVLAAGYFALYAIYPQRFPLGVQHYGAWFLDTYAILASNDAAALGYDIYAPNPLDPFHRPHVYTHWWLGLGKLGLTRLDVMWLGLLFNVGFFGVAVARLRPREWREVAWYFLIFCASPTLLALDRANNDLVVFILLAPVVPCLLARQPWVRMMPVPLIAVATGLKFYPAIAGLLLLVGGDRRSVRIRFLVALPIFAGVALSLADDLARLGRMVPQPEGLMTFGAANVFRALGLTGAPALAAGLAFAFTLSVLFWRTPMLQKWKVTESIRADWLSFVLGAALLTGCFFTGTNFGYRWIFALWLAPLLWRLPRDSSAPPGVRRMATITAALLGVMLWVDALAAIILNALIGHQSLELIIALADAFFLIEQPFVWAFFVCLIGFLTHFLRSTLQP